MPIGLPGTGYAQGLKGLFPHLDEFLSLVSIDPYKIRSFGNALVSKEDLTDLGINDIMDIGSSGSLLYPEEKLKEKVSKRMKDGVYYERSRGRNGMASGFHSIIAKHFDKIPSNDIALASKLVDGRTFNPPKYMNRAVYSKDGDIIRWEPMGIPYNRRSTYNDFYKKLVVHPWFTRERILSNWMANGRKMVFESRDDDNGTGEEGEVPYSALLSKTAGLINDNRDNEVDIKMKNETWKEITERLLLELYETNDPWIDQEIQENSKSFPKLDSFIVKRFIEKEKGLDIKDPKYEELSVDVGRFLDKKEKYDQHFDDLFVFKNKEVLTALTYKKILSFFDGFENDDAQEAFIKPLYEFGKKVFDKKYREESNVPSSVSECIIKDLFYTALEADVEKSRCGYPDFFNR